MFTFSFVTGRMQIWKVLYTLVHIPPQSSLSTVFYFYISLAGHLNSYIFHCLSCLTYYYTRMTYVTVVEMHTWRWLTCCTICFSLLGELIYTATVSKTRSSWTTAKGSMRLTAIGWSNIVLVYESQWMWYVRDMCCLATVFVKDVELYIV